MALLNEGVTAVFGLGNFGRAVLAVRPDSQNIPSEYLDDYTKYVNVTYPDGRTGKRYPWSVTQPGTPEQRAQWERFFRGTHLFGLFDAAKRAQWYTVSLPSGLFYYTYYMSQYLVGVFLAISGRAISGLALSGCSYI